MNFIHIGAGAGDLDPSSNFRDGFSEYVKKNKSKNKKIFLVEANPKNIKKLRESWKKYKAVKILNYAIIPNRFKKKKLNFFIAKMMLLIINYYQVILTILRDIFQYLKLNISSLKL